MYGTGAPVTVAIVNYKKAVVKDLAISMRQREARNRVDDELDAELLSQLPEPISPVSEEEVPLID